MQENKLTAREIFEQLTTLQKQLTENSQTSLLRLSDVLACVEEESEGEQIADICDVFKTRELTLLKLLELYERMYDDVQNEAVKKVDLISRAFDRNMAFINDSANNSEDKHAALGYVTDKIAELVAQILVDKEN